VGNNLAAANKRQHAVLEHWTVTCWLFTLTLITGGEAACLSQLKNTWYTLTGLSPVRFWQKRLLK